MEAHACDEWPISSGRFTANGEAVNIRQHTTIEERLEAARDFLKVYDVGIPCAVDTIENSFEARYATWPFRWYVLNQGKVVYQAQPKDCTYDPAELERFLERL